MIRRQIVRSLTIAAIAFAGIGALYVGSQHNRPTPGELHVVIPSASDTPAPAVDVPAPVVDMPLQPQPTIIPTPAAPAAPEPTTTTTRPASSLTSGHWTCDVNNHCLRDAAPDPGPNADATKPADTLASQDAAYAAELHAKMCANNPDWCDVDSSGRYVR